MKNKIALVGLFSLLALAGCRDESPISKEPVTPVGVDDDVPNGYVEMTVENTDPNQLSCAPNPGGTKVVHAELKDGGKLVSVAGQSPCTFELNVTGNALAAELVPPGTTIFNPVVIQEEGITLVMVSIVEHSGWQGDGSNFATVPSGVSIVAYVHNGTMWGEAHTLAQSDRALWIDYVDVTEEGAIHYYYMRDSLYEPMLLTQDGRPEADGRYRGEITLTGSKVTSSEPVRVANYEIGDP